MPPESIRKSVKSTSRRRSSTDGTISHDHASCHRVDEDIISRIRSLLLSRNDHKPPITPHPSGEDHRPSLPKIASDSHSPGKSLRAGLKDTDPSTLSGTISDLISEEQRKRKSGQIPTESRDTHSSSFSGTISDVISDVPTRWQSIETSADVPVVSTPQFRRVSSASELQPSTTSIPDATPKASKKWFRLPKLTLQDKKRCDPEIRSCIEIHPHVPSNDLQIHEDELDCCPPCDPRDIKPSKYIVNHPTMPGPALKIQPSDLACFLAGCPPGRANCEKHDRRTHTLHYRESVSNSRMPQDFRELGESLKRDVAKMGLTIQGVKIPTPPDNDGQDESSAVDEKQKSSKNSSAFVKAARGIPARSRKTPKPPALISPSSSVNSGSMDAFPLAAHYMELAVQESAPQFSTAVATNFSLPGYKDKRRSKRASATLRKKLSDSSMPESTLTITRSISEAVSTSLSKTSTPRTFVPPSKAQKEKLNLQVTTTSAQTPSPSQDRVVFDTPSFQTDMWDGPMPQTQVMESASQHVDLSPVHAVNWKASDASLNSSKNVSPPIKLLPIRSIDLRSSDVSLQLSKNVSPTLESSPVEAASWRPSDALSQAIKSISLPTELFPVDSPSYRPSDVSLQYVGNISPSIALSPVQVISAKPSEVSLSMVPLLSDTVGRETSRTSLSVTQPASCEIDDEHIKSATQYIDSPETHSIVSKPSEVSLNFTGPVLGSVVYDERLNSPLHYTRTPVTASIVSRPSEALTSFSAPISSGSTLEKVSDSVLNFSTPLTNEITYDEPTEVTEYMSLSAEDSVARRPSEALPSFSAPVWSHAKFEQASPSMLVSTGLVRNTMYDESVQASMSMATPSATGSIASKPPELLPSFSTPVWDNTKSVKASASTSFSTGSITTPVYNESAQASVSFASPSVTGSIVSKPSEPLPSFSIPFLGESKVQTTSGVAWNISETPADPIYNGTLQTSISDPTIHARESTISMLSEALLHLSTPIMSSFTSNTSSVAPLSYTAPSTRVSTVSKLSEAPLNISMPSLSTSTSSKSSVAPLSYAAPSARDSTVSKLSEAPISISMPSFGPSTNSKASPGPPSWTIPSGRDSTVSKLSDAPMSTPMPSLSHFTSSKVSAAPVSYTISSARDSTASKVSEVPMSMPVSSSSHPTSSKASVAPPSYTMPSARESIVTMASEESFSFTESAVIDTTVKKTSETPKGPAVPLYRGTIGDKAYEAFMNINYTKSLSFNSLVSTPIDISPNMTQPIIRTAIIDTPAESSLPSKLSTPSFRSSASRTTPARHALLKPSISEMQPIDLGLPMPPVLSTVPAEAMDLQSTMRIDYGELKMTIDRFTPQAQSTGVPAIESSPIRVSTPPMPLPASVLVSTTVPASQHPPNAVSVHISAKEPMLVSNTAAVNMPVAVQVSALAPELVNLSTPEVESAPRIVDETRPAPVGSSTPEPDFKYNSRAALEPVFVPSSAASLTPIGVPAQSTLYTPAMTSSPIGFSSPAGVIARSGLSTPVAVSMPIISSIRDSSSRSGSSTPIIPEPVAASTFANTSTSAGYLTPVSLSATSGLSSPAASIQQAAVTIPSAFVSPSRASTPVNVSRPAIIPSAPIVSARTMPEPKVDIQPVDVSISSGLSTSSVLATLSGLSTTSNTSEPVVPKPASLSIASEVSTPVIVSRSSIASAPIISEAIVNSQQTLGFMSSSVPTPLASVMPSAVSKQTMVATPSELTSLSDLSTSALAVVSTPTATATPAYVVEPAIVPMSSAVSPPMVTTKPVIEPSPALAAKSIVLTAPSSGVSTPAITAVSQPTIVSASARISMPSGPSSPSSLSTPAPMSSQTAATVRESIATILAGPALAPAATRDSAQTAISTLGYSLVEAPVVSDIPPPSSSVSGLASGKTSTYEPALASQQVNFSMAGPVPSTVTAIKSAPTAVSTPQPVRAEIVTYTHAADDTLSAITTPRLANVEISAIVSETTSTPGSVPEIESERPDSLKTVPELDCVSVPVFAREIAPVPIPEVKSALMVVSAFETTPEVRPASMIGLTVSTLQTPIPSPATVSELVPPPEFNKSTIIAQPILSSLSMSRLDSLVATPLEPPPKQAPMPDVKSVMVSTLQPLAVIESKTTSTVVEPPKVSAPRSDAKDTTLVVSIPKSVHEPRRGSKPKSVVVAPLKAQSELVPELRDERIAVSAPEPMEVLSVQVPSEVVASTTYTPQLEFKFDEPKSISKPTSKPISVGPASTSTFMAVPDHVYTSDAVSKSSASLEQIPASEPMEQVDDIVTSPTLKSAPPFVSVPKLAPAIISASRYPPPVFVSSLIPPAPVFVFPPAPVFVFPPAHTHLPVLVPTPVPTREPSPVSVVALAPSLPRPGRSSQLELEVAVDDARDLKIQTSVVNEVISEKTGIADLQISTEEIIPSRPVAQTVSKSTVSCTVPTHLDDLQKAKDLMETVRGQMQRVEDHVLRGDRGDLPKSHTLADCQSTNKDKSAKSPRVLQSELGIVSKDISMLQKPIAELSILPQDLSKTNETTSHVTKTEVSSTAIALTKNQNSPEQVPVFSKAIAIDPVSTEVDNLGVVVVAVGRDKASLDQSMKISDPASVIVESLHTAGAHADVSIPRDDVSATKHTKGDAIATSPRRPQPFPTSLNTAVKEEFDVTVEVEVRNASQNMELSPHNEQDRSPNAQLDMGEPKPRVVENLDENPEEATRSQRASTVPHGSEATVIVKSRKSKTSQRKSTAIKQADVETVARTVAKTDIPSPRRSVPKNQENEGAPASDTSTLSPKSTATYVKLGEVPENFTSRDSLTLPPDVMVKDTKKLDSSENMPKRKRSKGFRKGQMPIPTRNSSQNRVFSPNVLSSKSTATNSLSRFSPQGDVAAPVRKRSFERLVSKVGPTLRSVSSARSLRSIKSIQAREKLPPKKSLASKKDATVAIPRGISQSPEKTVLATSIPIRKEEAERLGSKNKTRKEEELPARPKTLSRKDDVNLATSKTLSRRNTVHWLKDILSCNGPYEARFTSLPARTRPDLQGLNQPRSQTAPVVPTSESDPSQNKRSKTAKQPETFSKTIDDLENLMNEALSMAREAADSHDHSMAPEPIGNAVKVLQKRRKSGKSAEIERKQSRIVARTRSESSTIASINESPLSYSDPSATDSEDDRGEGVSPMTKRSIVVSATKTRPRSTSGWPPTGRVSTPFPPASMPPSRDGSSPSTTVKKFSSMTTNQVYFSHDSNRVSGSVVTDQIQFSQSPADDKKMSGSPTRQVKASSPTGQLSVLSRGNLMMPSGSSKKLSTTIQAPADVRAAGTDSDTIGTELRLWSRETNALKGQSTIRSDTLEVYTSDNSSLATIKPEFKTDEIFSSAGSLKPEDSRKSSDKSPRRLSPTTKSKTEIPTVFRLEAENADLYDTCGDPALRRGKTQPLPKLTPQGTSRHRTLRSEHTLEEYLETASKLASKSVPSKREVRDYIIQHDHPPIHPRSSSRGLRQKAEQQQTMSKAHTTRIDGRENAKSMPTEPPPPPPVTRGIPSGIDTLEHFMGDHSHYSHSLDGSAADQEVLDFGADYGYSHHGGGKANAGGAQPPIELQDRARPNLPETSKTIKDKKHPFSLGGKRHISLQSEHLKGFSFTRSHKKAAIARDWSAGRKRFVASVACISTALIGILVGIYAGETPAIQYYIVDFHHYTVLGNVFFFIGLAISTFLFWPLPLLHGRKPYILGSMSLAMPLLFPQALAVGQFRSPYVSMWRVGLILPRALMGFVLGFANMNCKAMLTDLFGASLQSQNPHQEHADDFDVRRHGGGMGAWLGLWTWCSVGSIGFGFMIGAVIIDTLSPAWGFYVSICIIAFVMFLNVLCPEVRRSAFRRSVAEVIKENAVSRRLARGEVKMHMVQSGPKWWGEEFHYGIMLSKKMLRQPGFLVMALYTGWIYGQMVLIISLLGALTSKDYRFTSPLVGASVTSLPLGALLAIPFQKASFFSRARSKIINTDDATLKKKLSWSSHMLRRSIFVLCLPLAGILYTATSGGPPIPFIFPIIFAGIIGFLSSLALAECSGIITETFDTSDLQPGMTGRPRGSSGDKTVSKRTNYSSFPRVQSAFAMCSGIGYLVGATAAGVGGSLTRHLGQQAATGIMAGILFVLSILLLGTLIRFTNVQIIPDSKKAEMEQYHQARRQSVARRNSGIVEEEPWRPVIIGNPHHTTRRMCLLELGSMSRFSEIRRKNKLIDAKSLEAAHPNLAAIEDVKQFVHMKEHELKHKVSQSLSRSGSRKSQQTSDGPDQGDLGGHREMINRTSSGKGTRRRDPDTSRKATGVAVDKVIEE